MDLRQGNLGRISLEKKDFLKSSSETPATLLSRVSPGHCLDSASIAPFKSPTVLINMFRGIFTSLELKQIIKKRRDFEYSIHRISPIKNGKQVALN